MCRAHSLCASSRSSGGKAAYAAAVLAHSVSPPTGGMTRERSTENDGGWITNVQSVCQTLVESRPEGSRTSGSCAPARVGKPLVTVPNRLAKAICSASSRWCWPRKNTTLFAMAAARICAIVSSGRSAERRTPESSAPMLPVRRRMRNSVWGMLIVT